MISVITPVYNGERFLARTITSVLSQPEVSEYLLIDDGSTDGSLNLLLDWEKKDSRIKVLRHPDGKNHGRSETRNLGLKNASKEYVAFLDADDFYLTHRFKNDLKILMAPDDIDGVYNAIGAEFYDDYEGPRYDWLELTTLNEEIAPEDLFEKMGPMGDSGWFSGDGLTVRRSIFKKTGYFNENLEVREDTELWLRMALVSRLVPGNLSSPVAKRGLHGKNVFHKREAYKGTDSIFYFNLLTFSRKHCISSNRFCILWDRFYGAFKKCHPDRKGEIRFLVKSCQLLLDFGYWKYPCIRSQPKRSLRTLFNKTIKV